MKRAKLWIVLGMLVIAAGEGFSCTTPVYEYALMRWSADLYDVAVVHDEALGEVAIRTGQALADRSQDMENPANLMVRAIDLAAETNLQVKALYEGLDLPALVVHYPHWPDEAPTVVWSGAVSEEAGRRVAESPLRKRLAEELVEGNLPWILLESGDAKQDARARELLEAELAALAEQWNASLKELTPDEQPGSGQRGVSFPVLRLSHDDPEEAVLVAMLMKSEPDLEEFREGPIAFPCFGRARVLCALTAAGLSKATIVEVVDFFVGPCACQVKVQNPGTDLLVATDWSRCMQIFTNLDEPEAPELMGVAPVVEPDEPEIQRIPVEPVDPVESTAILGKAVIVLAATAVAIALLGLLIVKWKS